jgi:hypothetical protein
MRAGPREALRPRKREKRGAGLRRNWAGGGPRGRRRGDGLGWLGPGRKGEGAREGEKGRELLGRAGCSSPSLFFLFSKLKLFKQFHLNSNEFEFKLYTLNRNKQCSSMNAQTS